MTSLELSVSLAEDLFFSGFPFCVTSRDYNGLLARSYFLSGTLMKFARPGSPRWFFRVRSTLLFNLIPFDIGSLKIKVQSISVLFNKFQFFAISQTSNCWIGYKTFFIALHLFVLFANFFWILMGMPKESCEDYHVISLSSLHCRNMRWLAAERDASLIFPL